MQVLNYNPPLSAREYSFLEMGFKCTIIHQGNALLQHKLLYYSVCKNNRYMNSTVGCTVSRIDHHVEEIHVRS